jgi:putative Mn2+ efflux pump MntP
MVGAGLRGGPRDPAGLSRDPTRGLTLVVLSVATSLDALAVGLSLGMLETGIWYASLIIGLVTGGLSLLALRLGSRLGQAAGRRMEVVGGILLIAIGVRTLAGHGR